MSLLPQRIIPQGVPLGTVDDSGNVTIAENWWLLLYNLCAQTLGVSTGPTGLPADALQDLAGADFDAADADAITARLPLSNALTLAQASDVVVSASELPDIARALLLAQEPTLPDALAIAQPVSTITVGASPFTYKAPFAGVVAVTGGTVSAIALSRQGTSVTTGLTVGLIPVARFDSVVVTYTAAPTMTFIPGSPA